MTAATGHGASPADNRDIFVVEDSADVAKALCTTLADYGFRPVHFLTGRDFLHRLRGEMPALCIIDLGLPDMDGIELVRRVRNGRGCPIMILTGRHHVTDRILGLELGADDYVVKPFEPREIVARVNSILRRVARARSEGLGEHRVARFAGWSFAADRNLLVAPDGEEIELSLAEARLLEALLDRPNRILSRAQLMGDSEFDATDRSIDVRISRLRRKLQDRPDAPELIRTVYGAGYLLNTMVEWSPD